MFVLHIQLDAYDAYLSILFGNSAILDNIHRKIFRDAQVFRKYAMKL